MKKHMKSLFSAILVVIMIFSVSISSFSVAQETQSLVVSKDVRVKLDGHLLNFDVPPMIINNRTLVPFRKILEALGAEVKWNGFSRTVTATKENLNIELKIDSKDVFVNDEKTILDVSATIVDGRTLIPARFISESLGCEVDWENDTRTVLISTNDNVIEHTDKEFVIQGIAIGDSVTKVINILGEPARKDLSKYGFSWYIYNSDYSKYAQIGISDDKVVGIYTNTGDWQSKNGIKIGTSKDVVQSTFGEPLQGITKGNIIYKSGSTEYNAYLIDDCYTTIFYDLHSDNTVTAVLLIKKETEEALDGNFGVASDALKISFERQSIDLANAARTKFNKSIFKWDDVISGVARAHSVDMVQNNYFSHKNLEGKSPFERMDEGNIDYIMAAENIAAGQSMAIFAHEGLMNSKGHRNNILGDCERLGVGVAFGGDYEVYYTQNFFTPKN